MDGSACGFNALAIERVRKRDSERLYLSVKVVATYEHVGSSACSTHAKMSLCNQQLFALSLLLLPHTDCWLPTAALPIATRLPSSFAGRQLYFLIKCFMFSAV